MPDYPRPEPFMGDELRALGEALGDDLHNFEDLHDLLGGQGTPDDVRHEDILGRGDFPRIRPILVALAARATGAEGRMDIEVQHAAEVLYAVLVVHDLTLGREGGRRRRVARKLLQRSAGWLGRNHLTLRAIELARHAPHPDVLGEILDTLRAFTDGQTLAQALQEGDIPTREDWQEHADAHSGALFAFCCRAGGYVAGADRTKLSALGRYGRHMGRLWHIAEDVAVLRYGDPGPYLVARALGGRPMYPVVAAAERYPEIGRAWTKLVVEPVLEDAVQLAADVLAAGGNQQAYAIMAQESWAARRAIRTLDDSPHRQRLEQLAVTLLKPAARGSES
ncbi:MAG: polyprenyl synthetase family protein [Proteobacteria bacterium]|nr:polyprenyl synthetase family protein [Pseudomonadota bacterium]